jgi:hypothetical protein
VRDLLAAEPATMHFEIERAGRIWTTEVDLQLPTESDGDASL